MVVTLLAFWRRMHLHYSQLRFKYDLYTLRDRLRRAAMYGEVSAESWVFDYFDRTISKNIGQSYYITLAHIIILGYRHENDENLLKFKQKLKKETEGSEFYKKLQSDLQEASVRYVMNQHYVTVNWVLVPILTPIFGTAVLLSKLNGWMSKTFILPEVSDSNRLAY